jgi:DMSO/TMAO reductase YedYZ molybdopterin-dependent catalytic subunit
MLVLAGGQSVGGPLRRLSFLGPHGDNPGGGPNGFQVNKTAAAVGVTREQAGSAWVLRVVGPAGATELAREDLLRMAQATERLPIACVEGWSTTQEWTGVRLADLAALAGARADDTVLVESLQRAGAFRQATLDSGAVRDQRSLLALKVNGADLSLDHGFPARVIVPALPGVHCTKWVASMRFGAA